MKTLFPVFILIVVMSFSVFSQDEAVQTLDLRDGTAIDAEILGVEEDGLKVKYLNNIELKIPWNYLDPDTAYSIKRALWEAEIERRPGNSEKTATDYIDLAKWCKSHDLLKHADAIYEFIISNMDTDNIEARSELGYERHNGKWYKTDDWEKEVAKSEKKTDDTPDKTEPKPDDTIKKKIRIKLKIVITHKLDSRTPELQSSKDLETIIKEKLEDMGYKVVTTNADYYIEGSAFINQIKAVTFMNEVLSVKFEGDLSFSIKDPQNKEIKKDKVVGRSGRNDLRQAIDDLFEDLATSSVSRILTICKN